LVSDFVGTNGEPYMKFDLVGSCDHVYEFIQNFECLNGPACWWWETIFCKLLCII